MLGALSRIIGGPTPEPAAPAAAGAAAATAAASDDGSDDEPLDLDDAIARADELLQAGGISGPERAHESDSEVDEDEINRQTAAAGAPRCLDEHRLVTAPTVTHSHGLLPACGGARAAAAAAQRSKQAAGRAAAARRRRAAAAPSPAAKRGRLSVPAAGACARA